MDSLLDLHPLALFGLAVLAIVASSPLVVVLVLRGERKRRAMWRRVAELHGLTLDRGAIRGVKYGQIIHVHEDIRGSTRGSGSSYTIVSAALASGPAGIPAAALRMLTFERRSFRVDDAWLSEAIETTARNAHYLEQERNKSQPALVR
jgi:hypothetical protein